MSSDLTLTPIRDSHCTLCPLGGMASSERDVCRVESKDTPYLIVVKNPPSEKMKREIFTYLEEVGFNPEDFSFSAAVKCRVWDANITKTMTKTCSTNYLSEEIKRHKYKWVIAFGNEALQATTGKAQVTKYRAQVHPSIHRAETKVFPTIAPGAVSRNPGQRSSFIADLTYFRTLSEDAGGTSKRLPDRIRTITSTTGLKALRDDLLTCEGYAFDIETNGFNEYEADSEMVSLALSTWDKGATEPQRCYAIPLSHPGSAFVGNWRKVLETLGKYMGVPKKRVAHNGKFDLRWLHEFGCSFDLTFDTMLAAHLLDENRAKGLKPLARSLLNVPPWEMETKALQYEPIKKVLKYNALDTWYTAHLYFIFRDQLVNERPRLGKLMQLMSVPASNIFTEIERKGIWVDREILQTNAKIAEETLADIDGKLMAHVPPRDEWPDNLKEVNFNASNFARWLLFEHLGLPVIARGKDKEDGSPGNPSMAEGVLQMLNKRHPHEVLDLLLKRVKWQKFSSSFFSSYLDQIDDNDRIHTTFKLTGTVTGRLSSGKGDADKVTGRVSNRGVNLQQVPRDKFVKGIFGGAPGSVFLECDYSQIELRVAAAIAREPTMISLYQQGEDIHTATAMKMTGKPASQVTGDERKKAKPVNFGFLYGMSANTFVDTAWNNYGVEVTPHEAEVFRRAYFEQFPELLTWHRRQRQLAQKFGRVESPLGRVRHLPDIYSPDRKVAAEAGRQAINSPVQSFASDLAILALVNITRDFKRKGLKAFSVGAVHDALNFEVPEDEVRVAAPLIKYHMENVPLMKHFGYHMPVPILGDVALSRYWGDKEEVPEDILLDEGKFDKWLKSHGL